MSEKTIYYPVVIIIAIIGIVAMVSFAVLSRCSPGLSPSAPSDLRAEISDGKNVLLSWQDNADNEWYFVVLRNDKFVAKSLKESYLDIATDWETEYIYKVFAVGEYGNSDTVFVKAETPQRPEPPKTPYFFRVDSVGFDLVVLSWEDVANETGYEIFQNEKLIAKLRENVTDYMAVDLEPGSKYEFKLRAFNDYGFSGFTYELVTTREKGLLYFKGEK